MTYKIKWMCFGEDETIGELTLPPREKLLSYRSFAEVLAAVCPFCGSTGDKCRPFIWKEKGDKK